ncbi:Sec-independent protein translocase subunit TatB [Streptomyces monashensis]|uniref:Preprotein translocase n=1 Tax=Streptomyces monashensis TaxID=1678012 RepID=A0A1S2PDL5_9ACTN|nr:Sec-independent protein translocase subunit TatB [Streptomyces monashensis]OIJ91871.1 preprotein translocase [Streptomyces monashensis]
MFPNISLVDLLTLTILAVLLFGPDKLPEIVQSVVGFLRKVREFSESAKQEVRDELGPEFKDFEFEHLHPRTLIRKHVLDGDDLGVDEIRRALDPRAELSEVTDAVRGAANDSRDTPPTESRTPSPEKTAAAPGTHTTFDPDAT